MTTTTSPDTKVERKLDSFAEHLCVRRDLTERTIADYVGTLRRLHPAIGPLAAYRNIRKKAIPTLFDYSGLRSKELCSRKIADVFFASQTVPV